MSNVCFQTCYYFTDSIGEYHDIAMSLCGELKNGKVPLGKFIYSIKHLKISRSFQNNVWYKKAFHFQAPPFVNPKGLYLGFTLKHQLYYTELYKLSPDVIFHMVNFHEPWDSIGKCFFMLEKLLSLSFY